MYTQYLAETKAIDYGEPIIQDEVSRLKAGTASTIEYIERAYEFVRDQISHSWDIQSPIVSRKASEVLEKKRVNAFFCVMTPLPGLRPDPPSPGAGRHAWMPSAIQG